MRHVIFISKNAIIKLFFITLLLSGITYWLNSSVLQQYLPTFSKPEKEIAPVESPISKYILENGYQIEFPTSEE